LRILVVDDEPDVRAVLGKVLAKFGHEVQAASDGLQALDMFHAGDFEIILTDVRMPRLDGLELLRRIKEIECSPAEVIMITAHGEVDNAIKALRLGAFDYLRKPVNLEELEVTLERIAAYRGLVDRYSRLNQEFDQRLASQTQALRREAERLRRAYLEEVGLGELEIYSAAMRDVLRLAEKYSAEAELNVLIQGESGTGKELLARYLHCFGQTDPSSPFIAVNCSAISPELFESELFGHEPGAFTGARREGRRGMIQAAESGTLFLDEIGEMPAAHQVKLLRVLEDRKFYRLGGSREIPVKARFVCATNKDLGREVDEGRFRLDLYYRINTAVLEIPPLRERREEIVPLARRLAAKAAARRGLKLGRFTPEAEKVLMEHPWPGNVRQLKNVMDRLALIGPWERIGAGDIPFLGATGARAENRTQADPVLGRDGFSLPENSLDLGRLTKEIIIRSLERHGGNVSQTARYLGITRRVLQTRLKKMDPS